MRRVLFLFSLLMSFGAPAQVLISKSTNYVQTFDSLANGSGGKTNAAWENNVTLPGWYAVTKAKGAYQSYRISNGADKSNGLYSFGLATSPDRALGSIASASPVAIAFGVRFKNDTEQALSNIVVSFVGEQWRNSTSSSAEQTLACSYRASPSPLTDLAPGSEEGWVRVPALDFTRLHRGGEAAPLDGNAEGNHKHFENVLLPDASLKPGEELFLRWVDIDEAGQNDHGLAIDDLVVKFAAAKR